MSDDGILRRIPASIREGNGITVTYGGGSYTIGADLDTLSVTPAGAAAPVNLASTLADLIAANKGTSNITVCDGGFYDVPNSSNNVICDGGNF